jgi:glutamine amidotransferase
MIGIINYGMGNLTSILNTLNVLNIPAKIIDKPEHFAEVDKLILPGVGAFGRAMENMRELGIIDCIKKDVLVNKKPILGICLGMQLFLTESNEHGLHEGLNLIEGTVKSMVGKVHNNPIPHMGWNDASVENNPLIAGENSIYYFVHNYYCDVADKAHVIGTTNYEFEFPSIIAKQNIYGVQFHPEKSQKMGLDIFSAFNNL